MTQQEIREHLHMQAPSYGLRGSSYKYFVKGKNGTWREPGGENWCAVIERDLPAKEKERVPRG